MTDRKPIVNTKELEFPETVYVRDIDNRVFQGIVLRILSHIEGITLLEGNLLDSIMGRSGQENVKGIQCDQNMKDHTVNIKVEVNIHYGISIPEKAEEIQTKIAEEITKLTGLHVASVHVVFRSVVSENERSSPVKSPPDFSKGTIEEEYSDEF